MSHVPPGITLQDARAGLAAWFAPWVLDLGFTVEHLEPGLARCRLPVNPRLNRIGGLVSGQALMALADTTMVFAIASGLSEPRDFATVGQNATFFRPLIDRPAISEARVLKPGRTLIFGEIRIFPEDAPRSLAVHATTTYALAPIRNQGAA